MTPRTPVFAFAWLLLPMVLLLMASPASGLNINSYSAILIDASTGQVLFEQNADGRIPPASITKILTLYLVFEAMERGQLRLNESVRVSVRAASTGGSRMGLKAGATVTVEQLIKGMAIFSANDACVAVAEHMSGSVSRFVQRMNLKSRQLGMSNSFFVNPNGLPAKGQITTARDIAKLSLAYLRRFPESLRVHSMQSYTYNKVTQSNRNRLLGRCLGVDGIKTGWVCASGYNLSATAKRENTRLIAVVLGAKNPGIRTIETHRLLEDGFAQLGFPPQPVPGLQTASVHQSDEGGSCEVAVTSKHSAKSRTRGKASVTAVKGRSATRSGGVQSTVGKASAPTAVTKAASKRQQRAQPAITAESVKSGQSTKNRTVSKSAPAKNKKAAAGKGSPKGAALKTSSPKGKAPATSAKATAKTTAALKSSTGSRATP